jgi:hypothetical protein
MVMFSDQNGTQVMSQMQPRASVGTVHVVGQPKVRNDHKKVIQWTSTSPRENV